MSEVKCWPGAMCRIIAREPWVRDRFVVVEERERFPPGRHCVCCGYVDRLWRLNEPLRVVTPQFEGEVLNMCDCVLVPLNPDTEATGDESAAYLPKLPSARPRDADVNSPLSNQEHA